MPESAVVTFKLSVTHTRRLLDELHGNKEDASKLARDYTGKIGQVQRQRVVELNDIIRVIEG